MIELIVKIALAFELRKAVLMYHMTPNPNIMKRA
jgi:hypothetical protein